MAWDQEADFEEGDVTDFDSVTNSPTASTGSVKNGIYGCEITISGTGREEGRFNSPVAEQTRMVSECWMNPNSITMNSTNFRLMAVAEGNDLAISSNALTNLGYDGADYFIRSTIFTDGGAGSSTADHVISDGWNHIRKVIEYAANNSSNDATLRLYINAVLKETISGIDLFDDKTESVGFGKLDGVDAGTGGTLYLDDCKIANTIEPFPTSFLASGTQIIQHWFQRYQDFMDELKRGLIPPDRLQERYGTLMAQMPA